jgi:hypothetical protein
MVNRGEPSGAPDVGGVNPAWTLVPTFVTTPGLESVTFYLTGIVGRIEDDGGGPQWNNYIVAYAVSDPIPLDDTFDLTKIGEVTLTITEYPVSTAYARDASGDRLCTASGTMTISPMDDAEVHESNVLAGTNGCQDEDDAFGCERVFSEDGVLSMAGTIGGHDFRVCFGGLGGIRRSGPFEAILSPPHAVTECSGMPLSFTIDCEMVCEFLYGWILTIDDGTNVVKIPFNPDPSQTNFAATISATGITLCGDVVNFSAYMADFTGYVGYHPFLAACPDMPVAMQCDLPDTLGAVGRFENGTCGCSPHSEQLVLTSGALPLCTTTGLPPSVPDFNSANDYFIGDFVFGGSFGQYINWRLMVYYGTTGGLRWAALDGNGCYFSGGSITWDCDSLSGTTGNMYSEIMLGCCMDDIGESYIDFGGTG